LIICGIVRILDEMHFAFVLRGQVFQEFAINVVTDPIVVWYW